MAKATKPSTKKPVSPAKRDSKKSTRKVAPPTYKTLRLQKRIKSQQKPLKGAFKLMKENLQHLYKHKKLFFGISSIYFIVSIMLVSGLTTGADYNLLKDSVGELFTGFGSQIGTGITLFGLLIGGGSGKVSESGSLYQTMLLIVMSLVIIWALRQTYAKVKISIKDSFYRSMLPLIQFILVGLVIGAQLIPLFIGTSLYAVVVSQAIAVTLVERLIWGIFIFGLVVLTLYMICSSVFALYIVTLPEIQPMQALRSARELVRYRRWTVMRKIIFLPFALFMLLAMIMIPVLLYLTFMAQWVFAFLSIVVVVVSHGYMYRLYRELL